MNTGTWYVDHNFEQFHIGRMLSRVSLLRTTRWTGSRAFSNSRPVLGEQYDVVVVGE